jgi:hypothetical protein
MKHASLGILLIVALVALLDTAIFRSGFYARVLLPRSIAGNNYYFTLFERMRPSSNKTDILVIGDSRIAEGFSAKQANSVSGIGSFKFVHGGVGATTLRSWYYELKVIDPDANRFRAIVIALTGYRKFWPEADLWNRLLDVDLLAPIIDSVDFFDLSLSYPDVSVRLKLWSRILFQSQNYSADFRDLLRHPIQRYDGVIYRYDVKGDYATNYPGHPETMEGLAFNPSTRELSYPSRLSPAERAAVHSRFNGSNVNWADELEQYSEYWIGRLIERYHNSDTMLIFIRPPNSPLPEALNERGSPLMRFVPALQHTKGIKLMDEDAFSVFEQPKYFFDTFHLNSTGRRGFSQALGERVVRKLTAAPPAVQ